jgi:hypothetical protein
MKNRYPLGHAGFDATPSFPFENHHNGISQPS